MGEIMDYQSALKSCVLRDTSPSASYDHLLFPDDRFLGGGATDDLFPVEDLLVDFSNDGPAGEDDDGSGSGSFQEKDDFGSVSSNDDGTSSCFFSSSQLAVPDDDDLAELEWVSHFVHDSVPEFPPLCGITLPCREPVPVEPPCFPTHIPVRPRSKRPRVARREHPSSSSSGNSSCLSFAGPGDSSMSVGVEQARKKGEKRVGCGGVAESQRRCSHCQAERTPQWRAEPEGPKTLCNACGVRYKSGRLVPEYRPACSPTFVVEKHSNSHRKVMEMRRRKESSCLYEK